MYHETYVILTCSGDKAYKDAVRLVAAQRGVTIADLVRVALEKECGGELSKAGVFFAQSGSKKKQTVSKKNKGGKS